jgi:DNA primase
VLVEGPFDALSVWQATGMPAIAIGGVTVSRRMRHDLAQLAGKLHIMLDGEAMHNSIKLRFALMDQHHCTTIVVPEGKDPGNLEPEKIKELLCRNK